MKRRELLVAGAVVAIAGCSSDQTDEDPASDGDQEPLGETNTENESNGTDPTAENESDTGNETDDEPSEESEGPTDPELAQEHIDAAQDALTSAVDELVSQGKPNATFGEALDAGVGLNSPELIEDHLATVRSEQQDARQYETTGDQGTTLEAIGAAEAAIRTLVDVQPQLAEVCSDVEYLLEDLFAREFDKISGSTLQRDLEQRQSAIDDVESAVKAALKTDLGRVNALNADGLGNERDTLVTEYESMSSLVEGSLALIDAEEVFWPARDRYPDEGEGGAEAVEDQFIEALEAYQTADSAVNGTNIRVLQEEINALQCYTGHLQTAAEHYRWAMDHYRYEEYSEAADQRDQADVQINSAADCSALDIPS